MSTVCDAASMSSRFGQLDEAEDVLVRARGKLSQCWSQILALIDFDEAFSVVFLILSQNQLLERGYQLCQNILQGHSKEALERSVTLVLHDEGHHNKLFEALYLIGRYDILEDYLDVCINGNEYLHQTLRLPCSLSLDRKAIYEVFSGMTQEQADQILVPKLTFENWSVPEIGRPLEEAFIRNLQPGNYNKLINQLYRALVEIQSDNLASHLELFTTPEQPVVFTANDEEDEDNFYPRAYQYPHGLCVIINVKKFMEPRVPEEEIPLNERHGSDIDQERLTGTFKLLGFKVIHLNNPDYERIEQFFKNLRTNQALSAFACLAVCVMTHGDVDDNIYLHDRTPISVRDLRKLCFCESLLDKPRLYFVQACRGERGLTPVLLVQDSSTVVTNREADCIISAATVGGHSAMRSQTEGSWYITDLCRALQEYGHTHSIKYVLRKTRESLKNRVEKLDNTFVTQLSEDKDTLLKEVQLQRADSDHFVEGITDIIEMEIKDDLIDQALEDMIQEKLREYQQLMSQRMMNNSE
ncbi:unnamed protein product [Meganyctiphanes norvegica]|uniref:Caspase-8 n=1 Tax=Meganyctiphanes norvegica TaxID=48144 RepID=A0AAV2RLV3_MEGNR